MNYWTYPTENTSETGMYGYRLTGNTSGEYVQLYKVTGSGYSARCVALENGDTYSGTLYRNNNCNREYSSTAPRYTTNTASHSTRMADAKVAVKSMVTELVKNNNKDGVAGNNDDDIVEIQLITFANTAKAQGSPTTTDTLSTTIDGLNATGGTNWEDALDEAQKVNFGANDKDPTYIIFVSDGDPTYRLTRDGGTTGENAYAGSENGKYYYGSGNSDNNGKNYAQASREAREAVNANYKLYAIGVYGDVNEMNRLVNYAYTGDGRKTAPFTCEIERLMIKIADNIAEKMFFEKNPVFIQKFYNKNYNKIERLINKKKKGV